MDRALLKDADFSRASLQRANLIGAIFEELASTMRICPARLSGADLVSASLGNACLAKAEMEFASLAKAVLRRTCLLAPI